MKNWSIRTRIIAGIILVNVIGMLVVATYLHQSYSGQLDVTEQKSATLGASVWQEMSKFAADDFGPLTSHDNALKYVEALKAMTGAEYGLLIDKSALDADTYAAEVEKAGRPNDWNERETYVLIASTDEAIADEMRIEATPDSIPEIGKIVGVENGACSKTCHNSVEGSGDFWKVRWSKDDKSRGHVVFPALDEGGKPVGVVYSIEDISAQADSARGALVNTTLVIVAGLLAATIVIGLMLNALVFARIERMMKSMEDISIRVAGGDFGAHFQADGTTDEIGRFETFFARFMDLIAGTLKSLMK